ncbi:MAG: pantoate--beta-alanine ligase [Armatimonadota bacterium]
MQVVHTIKEVRELVNAARSNGKNIGFVPTMGALHDGHISLIKASKSNNDFVVVSIFVNPTQFLPSEDLDSYPRTLASDTEKCEQNGVDVVFAPSANEMYPDNFNTWVEVYEIQDLYEGSRRKGHFKGVATVCMKLFNIVNPDRAYFGQKDYQQLLIIKKMIKDLNMHIEIVAVPTVREEDGLAMSSRNTYLSSRERHIAPIIYKSLKAAEDAYKMGSRDPKVLLAIVEDVLSTDTHIEPYYVELVDAETLLPVEKITKQVVILIAAKLGSTNLIDNIILG